MDTDFKKRVNHFYSEYQLDETRINNSNALLDAKILHERNKEGELGGNTILEEIKEAIKYIKKELGEFNFDTVVNACNVAELDPPVTVKEVEESAEIFNNIGSAEQIIERFYNLSSSILNMLNYLKNNSSLSASQIEMLSKRLGELSYFCKEINTKTKDIYEVAVQPVRAIIDEKVKDIEKGKEDNKRYLDGKKSIFLGELEDVLKDFNFFYKTPALDEHHFESSFPLEYQFDIFLNNDDMKYQDMYDTIASIDAEFASKFKCRSLVTYNSTKPKTYILSGRDEERIKDIYHHLMISFLHSYPMNNKKIALVDNQEESLLKPFMDRLNETSNSELIYFEPVIKGDYIKTFLNDLNNRVKEIDRRLSEEDIDDVFIYNNLHPDKPINIILLLINDYPFGMADDESVDLLSSILAKSNRCGIITVINYNKDYMVPKMKNISAKDLKPYVVNNLLPLEKGDFDEEEFFSNISLLMEYCK